MKDQELKAAMELFERKMRLCGIARENAKDKLQADIAKSCFNDFNRLAAQTFVTSAMYDMLLDSGAVLEDKNEKSD